MGVGASNDADWNEPGAKEKEQAPMLYYCCGSNTRRPSNRFGQLRMRGPSSTDEESDSDMPRRRRRSRPRHGRKNSRSRSKGKKSRKAVSRVDEESDELSDDALKSSSDYATPTKAADQDKPQARMIIEVSDEEDERSSNTKSGSEQLEEAAMPSGARSAPQRRRKSLQISAQAKSQQDNNINNPHVALGTDVVKGALKKNTAPKMRRQRSGSLPSGDRRVRFNHSVVFEHEVEPSLPDQQIQEAQVRLRSPSGTDLRIAAVSGSSSSPMTSAAPPKRKGSRPKDTVIANVKFSEGKIADKYDITKVELGSGATGKVKLAQRGKEQFAVKIISKDSPLVKDKEFLEEIDVLSRLDHPNLLHLIDVYDEADYVYLVTELHEGGELFDRILDKKVFPEKVVRNVAFSLVDALNYLHSQGIMHRDIKPENVLFHTKGPDSDVIISDFGFAKHLNNKEQLMRATSRRGTMGYAAPEIFKQEGYTEKCDIWSLGVILYIMLSGIPPFCKIDDPTSALKTPFWKHANNMKQVPDSDVEFPDFFWKHVSDKAKHFIGAMLRTNPLERISAADLLKHPFLKGAKRTGASSFSGDGLMNPDSYRGSAFRSMR